MFAVAIGRRLGYPLKLVNVPDHLLFRWDDENERFNVEYNGETGNVYPDEYYKTWPIKWDAEIHRAQKHAHWLTSLTPNNEAAKFLGSRFLAMEALGRYDEALQCLLAAMKFNLVGIPLKVGVMGNLFRKMLDGDGVPTVLVAMAYSLLDQHGYLRSGIHVGLVRTSMCSLALGRIRRCDVMQEYARLVNSLNGHHGSIPFNPLSHFVGYFSGAFDAIMHLVGVSPAHSAGKHQPSPATWPMPGATQSQRIFPEASQAAYPADFCFDTIVGLGGVQPSEPHHNRQNGEEK